MNASDGTSQPPSRLSSVDSLPSPDHRWTPYLQSRESEWAMPPSSWDRLLWVIGPLRELWPQEITRTAVRLVRAVHVR